MIIAIDPGKNKCGLAVLDAEGKVRDKSVVLREALANAVINLLAEYKIKTVIVGKSAFGKEVEKQISRLDLDANIIFVSEKNSTLEARKRYWQENKPNGLLRIIPTTLRVPPVPIDDYAAVILGERYLKS
ncbi:MAG: Holliday junction resolvase RuvX [Candidatus Margulisiibacteriota bacterium]